MAKARAARKSSRKVAMARKAKVGKARSAKPERAKTSAARAGSKPALVSVKKERKPAPVVEIPETPPPLPAPIASFTF